MESHSADPFDLSNDDGYRRWRDTKLATMPVDLAELRITISALSSPENHEIAALQQRCRHNNWAIFRTEQPGPGPGTDEALTAFAGHLGLDQLDHNLRAEDSGISAVTVSPNPGEGEYVPYTNRPLSWHTDGYYNPPDRQIRAWILFCVQDAADGGSNYILDHELLYLRLRDQDPELVEALMESDAMTIPANRMGGETIRPAQTGPVFSVTEDGVLHMRYSARKKNIEWKDSPKTHAAAKAIEALLSREAHPIYRYRLAPGEGIISNNVLHRRDGFSDDMESGRKRLVLRARYYQRVKGS